MIIVFSSFLDKINDFFKYSSCNYISRIIVIMILILYNFNLDFGKRKYEDTLCIEIGDIVLRVCVA